MSPLRVSPDAARLALLAATDLLLPLPPGEAGLHALLARRRCIQLDPLDAIGTNADLVALARVDGVGPGDLHRVLQGHSFEHFAKERCLLPAEVFPAWRDQAVETPWWRSDARARRLDPGLLAAVRDEIRDRGPLTAAELTDRGRVVPLDWSGWKGTSRAASLALELLWTRCELVVSGRSARGARRYDLPERALPAWHQAPAPADFARFALLERVQACGLLPRTAGPWWSMLHKERQGPLPDALVAEGRLIEVEIAGSRRRWLALPGFADRAGAPDDRMRILGPLDPLLWDRKLVSLVFGFDYVWEVYKPAAKRRWGWYVCPLLYAGRLVGRIEARVQDGALGVDQLWREPGAPWDPQAYRACLDRHAAALGVAPPLA